MEWVVYAKRPFAGPDSVLSYLARYTHRVAIANSRLLAFDGKRVSFKWKDYRRQGEARYGVMTLDAHEFIRRFLLHVLPSGFQRIRHFGFLGNRYRRTKLAVCRDLLAMTPPPSVTPARVDYRDRYEQLTGKSLRVCPVCTQGQMVRVETLPSSAPTQKPRWDSS